MNSTMQILFSMEEFQQKFGTSEDIFHKETGDPTDSFNVQTAKLAAGLLSGNYSKQEKEDDYEAKVSQFFFFFFVYEITFLIDTK